MIKTYQFINNEWIIYYKGIKLKCSTAKETSGILLDAAVSSVILPFSLCLSLPIDLLFSTCTLEFLKILRETSPLQIILSGFEGSHWVLDTLPFIWDNGPTKFNENREYRGHLQATQRFGYSHLSLSTGYETISVPSPL